MYFWLTLRISRKIFLQIFSFQLFDYYVDTDRLEMLPWTEMLPAYTAQPQSGLPQDSFVQTAATQALAFNLALLAEMSLPVLLAGPRGCGKTSLVQDRIRTVCSGEVAEVRAVIVLCLNFKIFDFQKNWNSNLYFNSILLQKIILKLTTLKFLL